MGQGQGQGLGQGQGQGQEQEQEQGQGQGQGQGKELVNPVASALADVKTCQAHVHAVSGCPLTSLKTSGEAERGAEEGTRTGAPAAVALAAMTAAFATDIFCCLMTIKSTFAGRSPN